MEKVLIYIHSKGGTASEAEHYKMIFKDAAVIGFDYHSQTPWEAKEEFQKFFDSVSIKYETISIIANSIGAFFAMNALADRNIANAYFISPIVNMEKLISDMILSISLYTFFSRMFDLMQHPVKIDNIFVS